MVGSPGSGGVVGTAAFGTDGGLGGTGRGHTAIVPAGSGEGPPVPATAIVGAEIAATRATAPIK
jgi:hypothetical protein